MFAKDVVSQNRFRRPQSFILHELLALLLSFLIMFANLYITSCIVFFRLDNMIIHPNRPVAIGVLDWELSTIGDPITDLVTCCLGYYTPPELTVFPCKY